MDKINIDPNKPFIFYENSYTNEEIEAFISNNNVIDIIDAYGSQQKELTEINNPSSDISNNCEGLVDNDMKNVGCWIYYPWRKKIVHCVNSKQFRILKTNRNRNLITQSEQSTLFNFTPAVIGLSVGHHIALNLVSSGIGEKIILADFDILETTNLNRVRTSIVNLGKKKIYVTMEDIYEVDPFITIKNYSAGITEDNVSDIINDRPNIIFEAIDDFRMKVILREKARSAGLPVVMFSNVGDNILVDVERYDLDDTIPIFNGVLGDLEKEMRETSIETDEVKNDYAIRIVSKENVSPRAAESVNAIGSTLVGRPQLMSTVTISGGLSAYIARKIALGEKISGRYLFKVSSIFKS